MDDGPAKVTVTPEKNDLYDASTGTYSEVLQGTESQPYLVGSITANGDYLLTGTSTTYLEVHGISDYSTGDVSIAGQNGTGTGSLTIDGIHFSVQNGISGGPLTIQNGATVSAGSVSSDVVFGDVKSGSTNLLNITGTGTSEVIGNISNFAPGDVLEFSGNTTDTQLSWTNNNDGTYTLYGVDSSGKKTELVKSLTFGTKADGTSYGPDDFTDVQSAATGFEVITCFLAGSMIRTTKGDVAVEDMQIGDEVVAYDWQNNKDITRPVIWVGKAHTTVRPELTDDEAGWPVRILKDAIADGVPYKDMLITAEHCLFFKGSFVPVRMLVNGVSIFYDKSITSYNYYHVETEQHPVITADGMLTESYLDTGNRASFRQEGKVVRIGGTVKTWAEDAGAPLCVDRAFVEPLFRALEWRENDVAGCRVPMETVELTSNPDLHLITETGATIRPIRHSGQQYSFMLPPDTKSVRIVSRASRPADTIGPFVDDRRYMGVAVADVRLVCARKSYDITAHLQTEKPAGWHDTDWTDCAWTNGNATLPLGEHLTHGQMGILSMTIRAAGPYCINNTQKQQAVAQSA
ncbi:Hint domain-containing protein [Acetobacter pasteurianus]|uniref:Hint domain-containing protein n=1 Tax=Acetobacter pasteurianus TaxID=438 RepID=UPI003D13320D